jgi:tetratricopeptide (TPR) repeat protein
LQRQTTISVWCERIIEGGWLLALILIPCYFNLLSSRHFEPDKATTLRAIVLVMAAAGLVRVLELWGSRPTHREAAPTPSGGALARAWRRLDAIPLALPALVYALVFVFTTFTSVVPGTSFWGSYQRLQGTYTNLSYIGLAAMIVLTLRRREQLERLITVLVLSSLIAVGYGLVQHLQYDPLPWKGDVITRIASTMGNSIFVAAYLIMVLPYALYRAIVSLHAAQQAPPAQGDSGADLGWALGYLLLVIGVLALVFGSLKFGAYVRTADLRYWWVYPGALIVSLGLFLLPTLRVHSSERMRMAMLWPGILLILYVLMVFFFYTFGQGAGQREEEFPGRIARDWALWMIGGVVSVLIAYVLFYVLPRRPEAPSRLLLRLQSAGMLVIAILILVTVFFTQSRGPWLGGGVALFMFFTLLLVRAWRLGRAGVDGSQIAAPRAALWRNLLIAELVLSLAAAVFIVAFNFVDAPVFDQLRRVPYLGRLGTLLDTSPGTTGDVRMKIWFGDDKAGGAVALITRDPLRTAIGWGPESMFVAYNVVYPPSLANVEARGASPDRSHEAYLDELVTKGLLGLISYLFVLISFFVLAWRLAARTTEWPMQVLVITCVAVILGHSIEGLFGIPIVSTLMMLWLTMAVLVVAGALAGQYSLDTAAQPARDPIAEQVAAVPATRAGQAARKGQGAASGRRARQGAAARGAAQGRAVAGRRARRESGSSAVIIYAVIMILALAGVWFFNVDNVYADMRFQQGQTYTDAPNAGLDQQIVGMDFLLQAIRMEPGQDFYYLNLGRTLMNITDIRRQTGETAAGQPKPDARVEDLLRLQDTLAVQSFIMRQTPLETLSYAQVVLERARQLNPLNKDHYANLARMYSFWYSRFDHNPEQLRQSIDWYRQGHDIAPQDVVILNEYAGAVALLGSDAQTRGDQAAAQASYAQAQQLLESSKQLDPRYADTDTRLAELLRLEGRAAEATDRYVALLETNPHALDTQINAIIEGLRGQPDQLKRLRDVYAAATAKKPDDAPLYSFMGLISVRAGDLPHAAESYAQLTKLQPNNVDARRNYALVLSDTQQYQQAATEAEAMLALAQQQQLPQQQTDAIQGLIQYLKVRAAGG